MTPESCEWGVILHLQRQLEKLRQKREREEKYPFFSPDALKGLQMIC